MIRLAVTDLDNTLIPAGAPHASAHAIAGVHAMLDAGLHFGPVTGRVPAAMRWMFDGDEACGMTGAFVNGQIVYADGKLIHEEPLDARGLAGVGERIAGIEGCALAIYDLDDVAGGRDCGTYYMGASREELARHAETYGPDPLTIEALDRPSYLKANLRCTIPWARMVDVRDGLRAEFPLFDFVFPVENGCFIDILPRGWGKGEAVKVLANHYGLALDEVVAFGDSENDISMFEVVAHPVAVANASEATMAAARHRIGACADDAVADALHAIAEAAATGGLPAFLR